MIWSQKQQNENTLQVRRILYKVRRIFHNNVVAVLKFQKLNILASSP